MRKTSLLLALMFVLCIPITGNAAAQYEASPFSLLIRPSISFDGTEAKCAATVIGESGGVHQILAVYKSLSTKKLQRIMPSWLV